MAVADIPCIGMDMERSCDQIDRTLLHKEGCRQGQSRCEVGEEPWYAPCEVLIVDEGVDLPATWRSHDVRGERLRRVSRAEGLSDALV